MARQYHFRFPSSQAALRFAHLVVWNLREDVALCRGGGSVTVIDAGARDRRQQLLSLAVRLAELGA